MSEAKTNAMRILERKKISYISHTYDCGGEFSDGLSIAETLGEDPSSVFKTLVTRGASKSYYVFVIPVACELDLKKAARSVGEKSVEMIHVNEINSVTGYIRGGCSPVGMKKQFKTVFASQADNIEKILVSGGKRGLQIELLPADLIAAVDGITADITMGERV